MAKKTPVATKKTPQKIDATKQLVDAIFTVKQLQNFIKEHGSLEKAPRCGGSGEGIGGTDRRVRPVAASP